MRLLEAIEVLAQAGFNVCELMNLNQTRAERGLHNENLLIAACEAFHRSPSYVSQENANNENMFHLRGSELYSTTTHGYLSKVQEEEVFWGDILGAILCLSCVALLAFMFLGYLTLDDLDLRVIERATIDEDEREAAGKIIPIVQQKHRVLVTILIVNSLAYEALPLFMDALIPAWLNVILSTSLILLFGEIIPSGIATGPQQLVIAASLEPVMKFLLWLFYPVAYPLTRLLDILVNEGGDPAAPSDGYNRMEMSALVRIQQEMAKSSGSTKRKAFKNTPFNQRINQWSDLKAELLERTAARDVGPDDEASTMVEQMAPPLTNLEVEIVEGALAMKTTLAFDVYTPLNKLYAIPETTVLDKDNMSRIYAKGYSRIPVYRPNPDDPDDMTAVLGFLLTRQLIMIDWDHDRTVNTLQLQKPICVSPRINCVDLLLLLQNQGPIMTFVTTVPELANAALRANRPIPPQAGFLGIVTLEDLVECLIQDRIYDELDVRDRDNAVNTLTRWAATTLQNFYRKKKRKRQSSILQQSNQSLIIEDPSESTALLSSERPSTHNYNGI